MIGTNFLFINKITDYFWHLTLPVLAMVIGGFASLTMLTKNSFLDEINKQHVITARAKGVSEKRVFYTGMYSECYAHSYFGFSFSIHKYSIHLLAINRGDFLFRWSWFAGF